MIKREQKFADQLLKNSVILEYLCDSDEPYTVPVYTEEKQFSVAKMHIAPDKNLVHNSLLQ